MQWKVELYSASRVMHEMSRHAMFQISHRTCSCANLDLAIIGLYGLCGDGKPDKSGKSPDRLYPMRLRVYRSAQLGQSLYTLHPILLLYIPLTWSLEQSPQRTSGRPRLEPLSSQMEVMPPTRLSPSFWQLELCACSRRTLVEGVSRSYGLQKESTRRSILGNVPR